MSWIEIVGRSFVVFFCLTAIVNAVLVCKDLMAGKWDDEN
jgi:hypothetical protein